MIELTTKQCHEMYGSSKKKQQNEISKSSKNMRHSQKDEKRNNPNMKEEKLPKKSSTFLKSSQNKESLSSLPNSSVKEKTLGAKIKEEPKDLNVSLLHLTQVASF